MLYSKPSSNPSPNLWPPALKFFPSVRADRVSSLWVKVSEYNPIQSDWYYLLYQIEKFYIQVVLSTDAEMAVITAGHQH